MSWISTPDSDNNVNSIKKYFRWVINFSYVMLVSFIIFWKITMRTNHICFLVLCNVTFIMNRALHSFNSFFILIHLMIYSRSKCEKITIFLFSCIFLHIVYFLVFQPLRLHMLFLHLFETLKVKMSYISTNFC